MGRTRRRNPFARELEKPQYRQRRRDKRQRRLEELTLEDIKQLPEYGNVICMHCRNILDICQCPVPLFVEEDPVGDIQDDIEEEFKNG